MRLKVETELMVGLKKKKGKSYVEIRVYEKNLCYNKVEHWKTVLNLP